ncbi:hypothetical protein PFLUV_G00172590 [Perca fluviatilis]|uniref:THAP-type domain-containing protein n=1 Tax=Perca fluviatilis TaxID=8168 RepID=A0A6A5EXD9_PERFL|nr:uncharacterized protein DDB_G0285291-like [Perca fluviatilis]KAF1379102.1 hypothetical protein PFLUV_G00172590 [Perca fluviatilis]
MPGKHCCVINCSSSSHDYRGNRKNPVLQFFRVPTWKQHEGEHVSDVTRRRRISWVAAIRRKDITFDHITQSTRVCSLHFHSGKPSYEMLENHPDWKPSLRLGHSDVKKTDEARFQRLVKRRTQHQDQQPLAQVQHQDQQPPAQHQDQQPLAQHQDQQPLAEHQELPSPAQHQKQDQDQQPLAEHQELPSPAQECVLCTCRRDVINCLLEENRKLKEELEEFKHLNAAMIIPRAVFPAPSLTRLMS